MAPRWLRPFLPQQDRFSHGYTDAKYVVVAAAMIGEVLQGGLVFGWNALALMLQARGNFSGRCTNPDEVNTGNNGTITCKAQEEALAVLWTIGVFALNFGPVLVGPILDGIGPRYTSVLGNLLNLLGLVFLGVSHTRGGVNLLHPGAILIGLGGITFHLAQFHISGLFPRKRGLISSLFVAGFTGCGIIFYILQRIFEDLHSTQAAYRGVMLVYGFVFCGGLIPVQLWLMPKDPFSVGQVYVWNGWRPITKLRGEVEVIEKSATDLPALNPNRKFATFGSASNGSIEMADQNGHNNGSVLTSSLVGGVADSADPRWSDGGAASNGGQAFQDIDLGGLGAVATRPKSETNGAGQEKSMSEPMTPTDPQVHPPLNSDVVWGPLVFEPRRFVELRKKSFKTQALSTESVGMGLFYTINVFWIQFYLGTTRLQLQYKGDKDHSYTDLANILPCAGIIAIPFIAWLLDKKGYGITLGTINALSVLTSVLQAIPSLPLQAVTLVVWTAARFFLYASYFTIFGVLFGFKNFGKMVAIDNTVNGLIGLLQLPVSWLGIRNLNGNFTAINVAQIVFLMPVFIFCAYMRKWETQDLVPIRPMEGEELPTHQVAPHKDKNRQRVIGSSRG